MQTINFHCIVHVYQVILGNTRRHEFSANAALFAAIGPRIV